MTISFAVMLDNFTKNMAKNNVLLWYETEAINLQQGNYLSSVTKLERIINNSGSILSGVKLIQFATSPPTVLISLGDNFEFSNKNLEEKLNVSTTFFIFDYLVVLRLEQNLLIYFNFKPKINKFFLMIISSYFFILFFFFNNLSFKNYKSRILFKRKFKMQRARARKISDRKIVEITTRLAHDIRSPLSTLALISGKIENPEIKNLQIAVISQIQQIASDLLIRKKSLSPVLVNENSITEISFFHLFEQLKSEYLIKSKSLSQKVDFYLDPDLREIAVYAPTFLYACLNNLIQNSFEATNHLDSPSISLHTKIVDKSLLQIEIFDNGKGIPLEILSKLGKVKMSYGKDNTTSGTGIGVFNTYHQVKEIGGKMKFESILNTKTTISIVLPIKLF